MTVEHDLPPPPPRDPDLLGDEIEESDPILRRIRAWVKSSPWWAISIALHLIVFLITALIYIPQLISSGEGEVELGFFKGKEDKLVEMVKDPGKNEAPPEEDPNKVEAAEAQT